MTTEKQIDIEFQEAYRRASKTTQKFPPDIMLKFYAYYKQATQDEGIHMPSGDNDIRNAFKLNALLQVKGLSATEAKRCYIDLVNEHIQ